MMPTATPTKTRRTSRTTGGHGGPHPGDFAGADPGSLDRLKAQEAAALASGLALPPPVYALGTPVVQAGRTNFRTKRTAWEQKPAFADVCSQALDRIAAERREDLEVRLADLVMDSDGALRSVPHAGPPDPADPRWLLNEAALTGLLSGLGLEKGTRYLADCPPSLRSMNANYWIQALAMDPARADKRWHLRTREAFDPAQAGQREAFAAVSSRYTPMDADVLTRLGAELMPQGARGDLLYDGSRFRLGASWFSDVQPADVCAGEVFRAYSWIDTRDDGTGSIRVRFGVERNLCLNLVILGRAEIRLSMRHAGDVDALRQQVRDALGHSTAAMESFAGAWTAARRDRILDEAAWTKVGTEGVFQRLVAADLVRVPGMKSDDLVARLQRAWEAEPGYSRADLVNAITRAAHEDSWRSVWASDDLEQTAGELLFAKVNWSRALEID